MTVNQYSSGRLTPPFSFVNEFLSLACFCFSVFQGVIDFKTVHFTILETTPALIVRQASYEKFYIYCADSRVTDVNLNPAGVCTGLIVITANLPCISYILFVNTAVNESCFVVSNFTYLAFHRIMWQFENCVKVFFFFDHIPLILDK